MNEQGKNEPAWIVRYGAVHGAIWRNIIDNGEITGSFYSVTFGRSYRDSSGAWRDAQSFRFDDLLVLAKIADECHSWIAWRISAEAAALAAGSKANGTTNESDRACAGEGDPSPLTPAAAQPTAAGEENGR